MTDDNIDKKNLEKCFQLFNLNKFEKQNLLTIFNILTIIDFSNIDTHLITPLFEILVACLEYENINLEKKSVSELYIFAKHRTLHQDVLIVLDKVVPFITDHAQLHQLFCILKKYLELGSNSYKKCINLLIKIAEHLGDSEKNILYENVLAKILTTGRSDDLAILIQLSFKWLNVDRRKELFNILIKYMLEDKSDDRIAQKNCVWLIISLFNRLTEEEKLNIFEINLLPLLESTNIFVKQAFAEILRDIEYPLNKRLSFLIQLLNDKENEVRRFGVNCLGDCIRANPQASNMDSFSDGIIELFFQQNCKEWTLIEALARHWVDESKLSALLIRFFNLIQKNPIKHISSGSISSVIKLLKFVKVKELKQEILTLLKTHLSTHPLYDETIAYLVGEMKGEDDLRALILNQLVNNNDHEVKEAAMQYVVFKKRKPLILRDLTVLEKKISYAFNKHHSKIQIRYIKSVPVKENNFIKTNNSLPLDLSTLYQKLPQQFKEELRAPHTFKSHLIKGLHSDNNYVFKYSYRWLYLDYVVRGSLESKIKWFNIVLSILQSAPSDNGMPYQQIIEDIAYDLVPIKEIYSHIIKLLPIIIHKDKQDFSRNEEFLLSNLLKHEPDQLLNYIKTIIFDLHYHEQLRISLLMQLARSLSDTDLQLIQLYIDIYNKLNGRIRRDVSELIRETLPHVDSKDISNQLLKSLCAINSNTQDEETIEHIIRFLINLISIRGGNAQGLYAVECLNHLVENIKNISLILLVCHEIEIYDLSNLSLLQPTIQLIDSKISVLKASNQYNSAWSDYREGNYQLSLDKTNKLIKIKQDKQQTIPYKLIFLKTSNLIALNRWKQAEKLINTHIDTEYDYSLHGFLDGTFKLHSNKISEAIELYKQACLTNPSWLIPLIQLHYLFLKISNYDESARFLKKIIKLNPRFKPHYSQYSLSYNNKSSEIYIPYKTSIPLLENKINEFIEQSISVLIHNNEAASQKLIKEKFEILKWELKKVFRTSLVDNLLIENTIPWQEFFNFPKQIKRWMQDLLINLIHQEIPPSFHKEYKIFHDRINNMQDITMQLNESGIQRLISDMDAQSFLSHYMNVQTICDFIKQYAFTDTLKEGYLLGLSNDISEAYNIITSTLGLNHWNIAYEALGVEATETSHTEKFMTKLLQQNKPVIMLLPILPDSDRGVTLDEVKFLINYARTNGPLKNVIFVLDAYNFLPMFILKKGNYKSDKISPCQSLAAVLNYLGQILEIDNNRLYSWLKPCLDHMLKTRIKNNLSLNVPEERKIYDEFLPDFEEFINNKLSFSVLLNKLSFSLKSIAETDINAFNNYIAYLTLLDTLLFSDVPWFGSSLQPSSQELICLFELQTMISDKLSMLQNKMNESFQSSYKYQAYHDDMENFLVYLKWLILDAQKGLEWLGISNYAFPQNNIRELASSYPICRLINSLNEPSLQPLQAKQSAKNKMPIINLKTPPTTKSLDNVTSNNKNEYEKGVVQREPLKLRKG